MSELSDPNRPTRHPIDWQKPDFYNEELLDAELRRVFDICHGCRRCFNLCDSFPKLFDLIDESKSGELDSVKSEDFKEVVDACTLCDICFVNKCPYVPPHEFDIDFPHLMLRAKAVEAKNKGASITQNLLSNPDTLATVGTNLSSLTNWAIDTNNKTTRKVIEKAAGFHPKAELPKYAKETFISYNKKNPAQANSKASGFGEKVVLYATCFANYHRPLLAKAARDILTHNGVTCEVVYPRCCGMPLFEKGQIDKAAKAAKDITTELLPWVKKGYKVLALVPSCALMLKMEWPLILADDEDVKEVSSATLDISEYLISLFKNKGVSGDLSTVGENITLHLACHSRAQNIGAKAAELLRLIPDTKVEVIERCSGHGGTWGMTVDHFETALKVGKPVFRQALKSENKFIASECPLASTHIKQGIEIENSEQSVLLTHAHPIEIFAHACGLLTLEDLKNDAI